MLYEVITDAAHHGPVPFYLDPAFWVGAAFLVVVLVLVKAAYGRIVRLLDMRGIAIRDRLEGARRIREEAQALLAEYQRKQRDALQESQDIIARSKAEAAKLKDQAA